MSALLALRSLVGYLRLPKKGHFYHQNSYKGIENYLLDCARCSLDNDALIQEWSVLVADRVTTNIQNIATNASNITTNTENIQTNAENISTNSENISTNSENIAENSDRIDALEANKVGYIDVSFDYGEITSDFVYTVTDADNDMYSYLPYSYFTDDSVEELKTVISEAGYGNIIISKLMDSNENAESIGVVMQSNEIAFYDNSYFRTDSGSPYSFIVADTSTLRIYVMGLSENKTVTLVRESSEDE